jgi:hypothetical protein
VPEVQSADPARRAAAEARRAVAAAAEERAAALAGFAAEAAAAAAAAQAEAASARAAAASVRCVTCDDVHDGHFEPCDYAFRFKCEPTAVLCYDCANACSSKLPECENHLGRDETLLLCGGAAPYRPAKCTGSCFLIECELECDKYACAECISVRFCSRKARGCTNLRTICPSCPDYEHGRRETRCEACATNEDTVGEELERVRAEARYGWREPDDEHFVDVTEYVMRWVPDDEDVPYERGSYKSVPQTTRLRDCQEEVAELDAATLVCEGTAERRGCLARRQQRLRVELPRAGFEEWSFRASSYGWARRM